MTAGPARLARRELLALAGGALVAGLAGPAGAAEPAAIRLDAERRRALAALPLLSGAPDLAGRLADRVVVLTFFASWCPPCHVEFDALNRLRADRDPAEVEIAAVNIFEDYLTVAGGLEAFLAGKAPAFTVLGGGERVAPLFGSVRRIPTLFVFGPEGEPRLHFVHEQGAKKTHASLAEIEAAIDLAS